MEVKFSKISSNKSICLKNRLMQQKSIAFGAYKGLTKKEFLSMANDYFSANKFRVPSEEKEAIKMIENAGSLEKFIKAKIETIRELKTLFENDNDIHIEFKKPEHIDIIPLYKVWISDKKHNKTFVMDNVFTDGKELVKEVKKGVEEVKSGYSIV